MADQENFRLCQEVKIDVVQYELTFHRPARTSRDILRSRKTAFFILNDGNGKRGIGECAPINGLSLESFDEAVSVLQRIASGQISLEEFILLLNVHSSVRFAVELACLDYSSGGRGILFAKENFDPIKINGLVWMNEIDSMYNEAINKVESGFDVIKFKVGALNFDEELKMIRSFRDKFPDIEIRLDANGAFAPDRALGQLKQLCELGIHSIEQPIKPGQWQVMGDLVAHSPIPIALDEELIGMTDISEKEKMLDLIKPQYLILKPSLHGGISGCNSWIDLAGTKGIGWWATSALESSIGLNAIAQWVATKGNSLPQGLGTGSLYENNFSSPWKVKDGYLVFDSKFKWNDMVIEA